MGTLLVFTRPIQASEIFLVWAGVEMESVWTFLGGEETAIFSSFSGFKVEATLKGEKLQISSRKKREKNPLIPPPPKCFSPLHKKNPVQSLGYGPAWKAGGRTLLYLKDRPGMGVDRVFSSALYKGRGRALNTSWTHGVGVVCSWSGLR